MKSINLSVFASAKVVMLPIILASCVQSPQVVEKPQPPEALAQAATQQLSGGPKVCETQTVQGEHSPCRAYQQEELCQPYEFNKVVRGVLETKLDISKKWQCVPALSSGTWGVSPKLLRNYGAYYDNKMRWNFPAPTFRLKRADPGLGIQGEKFKMLLTNQLGPTTVAEQRKCFEGTGANPRFRNDKDNYPNCFHGNETTNFHFHGFHISPQPLQDYVLLKLYPKDTRDIPNYRPDMTNEELRRLKSIGGAYRYDLDPLPYNQPEGTHWYHAHHHGATAMQVINGMAGTFIIEGPFDRWLNDQYGYDGSSNPRLKDRLMVIQQINDTLATSTPLVNGQGNPNVSVQPGEVQRWRFVGATTQASAQLEVFFGELDVRQIQMDGVQFSPENYRRQPLLTKDNNGRFKFVLSPGNRADFLVRARKNARSGDRFHVTQRVVGSVGEEVREKIEARKQAMQRFLKSNAPDIPVSADIPLMTISIMQPDGTNMDYPRNLPPLPEFLTPPRPNRTKQVNYEMFKPAQNNPAPIFKIDGQQVRNCVLAKMTMTLGRDERWIVMNRWNDGPARVPSSSGTLRNRGIAHPFHIHTNPFYVVRNGNDEYANHRDQYANGIWQDTIRLPLAKDGDPFPERASSVDLFMEFEDYTGGYVQHCHILGHEDRGMMTLVQTLCPNRPFFGTPVAGPDNCEIPRAPLPICQ